MEVVLCGQRDVANEEPQLPVRKRSKHPTEFVLFDVLYEDGTRTSNRKVPSTALGGLDGDQPAHAIIEAQDNEIAERSGRARPAIKLIVRALAARP